MTALISIASMAYISVGPTLHYMLSFVLYMYSYTYALRCNAEL